MCTTNDQSPGSAGAALRMVAAGLDYLNSEEARDLPAAGIGGVLVSLAGLDAKFAAAHASLLRRFDAADAHDLDGYGSSTAWLSARTGMTPAAAKTAVRHMRVLGQHQPLHEAMAAGQLSPSLAHEIAGWMRHLPAQLRAATVQILADAAVAGASREDLAALAAAAIARWEADNPDPDDDAGFEDRYLQVATTFGGAGCTRGNLTPQCAAALQAMLDALGKKRGPGDTRTEGQRYHDALQEGCELLLRSRLLPARAGADTQAIVHIPLGQLRTMPGGFELEQAWLNAQLGQTGYLTGNDATAAACDALTVPVVTGHADLNVIDQIIELALAAYDRTWHDPSDGDSAGGSPGDSGRIPLRKMSLTAYEALRYSIARLAIDFISGPSGLAAALRTGLLQVPYTTPSLPLDIGYSDTIPAHIRRAVMLRDKHCAWPRCDKPAAHCDVHHIVHKDDGGVTSVTNCLLLCQFHHDVCIHRWGWRIVLHPDATTTAYGPHGQVLHSHSPPAGPAPPASPIDWAA